MGNALAMPSRRSAGQENNPTEAKQNPRILSLFNI